MPPGFHETAFSPPEKPDGRFPRRNAEAEFTKALQDSLRESSLA
jgi:hypothetical protein